MKDRVWSLKNDIAQYQTHPNVRPRDAATIILMDRSSGALKILLGKRHGNHVFMANAYVFPGGRVDESDHRIKVARPLHPGTEAKLMRASRHGSPARARSIAVAVIRELCEETGLCIGEKAPADRLTTRAAAPGPHGDAWQSFAQAGLAPNPGALHFIARAITPPRLVRRYDTRFFAADISAVAHRIEGIVNAESELTQLFWLTPDEARAKPLSLITQRVLTDLEERLAGGMEPEASVPFYHPSGRHMVRELL